MDKELYFKLFNKLTDIMEEIKDLQCQMEEMYINSQTDESQE